jgi:hypothetical protein
MQTQSSITLYSLTQNSQQKCKVTCNEIHKIPVSRNQPSKDYSRLLANINSLHKDSEKYKRLYTMISTHLHPIMYWVSQQFCHLFFYQRKFYQKPLTNIRHVCSEIVTNRIHKKKLKESNKLPQGKNYFPTLTPTPDNTDF